MPRKTAKPPGRGRRKNDAAAHPRRRSAAPDSPPPAVRVRMYRQGLGDCFLLTFETADGSRHVLIDCGTVGATTTGVAMADVFAEIRSTTQNHLDLVIATHEHQDHVSGFRDTEEAFREVTFDNVWLAWTEDSADSLAQQLTKTEEDLGLALTRAVGILKSADPEGEMTKGLLGVLGEAPDFGFSFAPTVDEQMDYVRTKEGAKVEFLRPDRPPREESWLPGFRFYVLGPPRDEKALSDEGDGGGGLYGVLAGLAGPLVHDEPSAEAGPGGAGEASAAARELVEQQMPFDPQFGRDLKRARDVPLLAQNYLPARERWRSIENEWLRATSQLALQLGNLTNNTSLVLAIERIADGKVLLFPGDAQLGSWLSWHDPAMKWEVKDGDGVTKTVTADDLLARTVFYKVGHHASHNATASTEGLEKMATAGDLTAFIPVDRAVALRRSPAGSWKMPARLLYRRLLERCGGKVVRSDLGWAAAAPPGNEDEQELTDLATDDEWQAWKKNQDWAVDSKTVKFHVPEDPNGKRLYVDYVLGS